MKARFINMAAITAVLIWLPLFAALGQEKTQEAKEKELKLQQAIEEQKKAMSEQARILQDQTGEINRAIQEIERQSGSRDPNDPSRRGRGSVYISRDGSEPFVVNPGMNFQGFGYWTGSGDSERTSLDFSKTVKESTFSKQFSFEVDKTSKNVLMNISGDCKTGEIKVKILMPGGKTYSEVVIDESGNLNWRKSFTISEGENADKVGEWVFKIETSKATGYFRISLQTF